jgi:hypothetical protein
MFRRDGVPWIVVCIELRSDNILVFVLTHGKLGPFSNRVTGSFPGFHQFSAVMARTVEAVMAEVWNRPKEDQAWLYLLSAE